MKGCGKHQYLMSLMGETKLSDPQAGWRHKSTRCLWRIQLCLVVANTAFVCYFFIFTKNVFIAQSPRSVERFPRR